MLKSVYLPSADIQSDSCGWDETFVGAIPPDVPGNFSNTTIYGYTDAPA
jgi:hypothetical protein